jgi:alpha-glucosidase (family GH31 glycosyl hydrolase)
MLAQLHRHRRPQHLRAVSGHQQGLRHRLGQSLQDGHRAGFNEQTRWTSEVGDRVSFFVIAGNTTDEIYAGYRLLTGTTPMLPKAAYGYIQCKQRYSSQDEVLAVAKGYRDRHLPLDVIVVDWFYWTKMGQIDMDPVKWPDPAAMNRSSTTWVSRP